MGIFEVNAQRRTDTGTGAMRRLRRTGYVPAMYGAGKNPQQLTLLHEDLLKQLEHEEFYSQILTINVDNQPEKAVLKDLQRHPSQSKILHVDFMRISETAKLHMRVPLHFINEEKCEGVKQSGGSVSHHLTEVEIRCLPKDLPAFLEVDLAPVKLNEIIHLSNLMLPEGVELVGLRPKDAVRDLPVVSVHLARGTKADEDSDRESAVEAETPTDTDKDKDKKDKDKKS